jgi:hypothetical protein
MGSTCHARLFESKVKKGLFPLTASRRVTANGRESGAWQLHGCAAEQEVKRFSVHSKQKPGRDTNHRKATKALSTSPIKYQIDAIRVVLQLEHP